MSKLRISPGSLSSNPSKGRQRRGVELATCARDGGLLSASRALHALIQTSRLAEAQNADAVFESDAAVVLGYG